MTVKLIIPTAINQVTYLNQALISARRRGFTGEITVPTRRERAKAAILESKLMRFEETVPVVDAGEYTP